MDDLKIYLKNIKKSFGARKVLRDVSLEIKNDDYITILGKSGSGKSTLMNILGLVEQFDSGEFIFNHKKIYSGKDYSLLRLNNIGFVFQAYNLIPSLTCKENIELPLLYSKKKSKVEELAEKLDIYNLLDKRVNVLSGGEKQRVAIARALILDPALIIADEPTGNLDVANRNIVFDLFEKEHQKGRAIVMITHDSDTANQADTVYKLERGVLHEI